MQQKTIHDIGFTLIELMIVVAIIGVLAAVAIPSFSRYINEARTSDGIDKLKGLAEGAVSYYNMDHIYNSDGLTKQKYLYPGCQAMNADYSECEDVETTIDDGGVAVQGSKHKLVIAADEQPWERLGFAVDGPTYYQFRYRTSDDGQKFSAMAQAKLNEKNFDSGFVLRGTENGTLINMISADTVTNFSTLATEHTSW